MSSVPQAEQWREELESQFPPRPLYAPISQPADDIPKMSADTSVAECRPSDWEKRMIAAGMSGLDQDAEAILQQFGGWNGLGEMGWSMAKWSAALMAAPWLGALAGGIGGLIVGGPAGAAAGAAGGYELGTGVAIGAGAALLALGIKSLNDKMRESLGLFAKFLDMTRCDITPNRKFYEEAAAVYRQAAAAWFAGCILAGLTVVGARSLRRAYLNAAPRGEPPPPPGTRRLAPGETPENVIGEIDPKTGNVTIYDSAPPGPGENLPVPVGNTPPAPLPPPVPPALPPAPPALPPAHVPKSAPYDRPEIETKSGKAVKSKDAVKDWEDFLGPDQTNIDPRTGMPDPDRIWSADGKRSIRFGKHEMDSKPNKAHYHKETWHDDHVENVLQRVQQ